ncbi:mitochondrial transcription termination factor 3 [Carabus blaptoides fortunei]
MFSTKRIDTRLGHFQKTFGLAGNEVRLLTTKQPKLITYNMEHVKLNTFSIKEEMGFGEKQMKQLLLDVPKMWMMSQNSILNRFDYVHKTMKISHEQILQMPKILTSRKFRIQQRHLFLEKLSRAQYNPKSENYVSLEQLVAGTDSEFCANVAKSSVQAYNTFLKSL